MIKKPNIPQQSCHCCPHRDIILHIPLSVFFCFYNPRPIPSISVSMSLCHLILTIWYAYRHHRQFHRIISKLLVTRPIFFFFFFDLVFHNDSVYLCVVSSDSTNFFSLAYWSSFSPLSIPIRNLLPTRMTKWLKLGQFSGRVFTTQVD